MLDADARGILWSILDNPEDDLSRLAYADWLEEHGDVNYAMFIRTQIELESCNHIFDGDALSSGRYSKLLDTQNKLLIAYGNTWRERCFSLTIETWNDPGDVEWTIKIKWKRGFVYRIELPCEKFIVPGIAINIFSHHPVEEVIITNRSPVQYKNAGDVWGYFFVPDGGRSVDGSHHLPWCLNPLAELPERDAWTKKTATKEESIKTCSDLCVAYGRKLAMELRRGS